MHPKNNKDNDKNHIKIWFVFFPIYDGHDDDGKVSFYITLIVMIVAM